MRLLRVNEKGEFELVEHMAGNIPPYAILSHTWGADDEEVTFRDLINGRGKDKAGYHKLVLCAEWASRDSLWWFWVDTCCIDRSNPVEISEAINSMFSWYRESAKCYVYLSDVSTSGFANDDQSFQRSRWFTRGWTLQELLAPPSINFFSAEGRRLGDRYSLVPEIAHTTGISIPALQGSPLSRFSVEERLSWTSGRETRREEDMVYSLLGIFDVHIPLIYGEGREMAWKRLQGEIKATSTDQSPPTIPQNPGSHQEPLPSVEIALVQTLKGHFDCVHSVAFSPDSTRLASGSADDRIKLWNGYSDESFRTLKIRGYGNGSGVNSVAFSPDSVWLASGSIGGTGFEGRVKLRDARSGKCLRTFKGHDKGVYSVAFSPDSARLASASYDKTIRIWHVRSGQCLQTLRDHGDVVFSVAFSPDSTWLASASQDGTIKLWDARTGECLRTLEAHGDVIYSVAFSPDSARLASASYDDTINLWDVRSGEWLQTLEGHSDVVFSVTFSPDSNWLASASHDKTFKLWDARTGECLQTVEGHSDAVYSVAFSPDSDLLASSSYDKTIKVWSVQPL